MKKYLKKTKVEQNESLLEIMSEDNIDLASSMQKTLDLMKTMYPLDSEIIKSMQDNIDKINAESENLKDISVSDFDNTDD